MRKLYAKIIRKQSNQSHKNSRTAIKKKIMKIQFYALRAHFNWIDDVRSIFMNSINVVMADKSEEIMEQIWYYCYMWCTAVCLGACVEIKFLSNKKNCLE